MNAISKFHSTFPKKHNVFPVVHIAEPEQACRNAKIARESGADGIFLINHESPSGHLLKCYEAVRAMYPDMWIGLNFLGQSPIEAASLLPSDVDGLWVDDGGVYEDRYSDIKAKELSEHLISLQGKMEKSVLLFGGVAFKYQQVVHNLPDVTAKAMKYMDVVTTSGERTGVAADAAKIGTMKEVVGDFPIGLASGVSFENVFRFSSVSAFLVASSISESFVELDPARVELLIERVATMNDSQF